jgi:nucleotide-binding universal stress UspA family protein
MNILVAHDGSDHAGHALARAAGLAAKLGASLRLVMVVPDLCLSTEELSQADCDVVSGSLAAEAKGLMARAAAQAEALGVKAETVIRGGRPVDAIVEEAKASAADLLVVGSRGRHGARRFLLGSISSRIAEYAECDVLIVKN